MRSSRVTKYKPCCVTASGSDSTTDLATAPELTFQTPRRTRRLGRPPGDDAARASPRVVRRRPGRAAAAGVAAPGRASSRRSTRSCSMLSDALVLVDTGMNPVHIDQPGTRDSTRGSPPHADTADDRGRPPRGASRSGRSAPADLDGRDQYAPALRPRGQQRALRGRSDLRPARAPRAGARARGVSQRALEPPGPALRTARRRERSCSPVSSCCYARPRAGAPIAARWRSRADGACCSAAMRSSRARTSTTTTGRRRPILQWLDASAAPSDRAGGSATTRSRSSGTTPCRCTSSATRRTPTASASPLRTRARSQRSPAIPLRKFSTWKCSSEPCARSPASANPIRKAFPGRGAPAPRPPAPSSRRAHDRRELPDALERRDCGAHRGRIGGERERRGAGERALDDQLGAGRRVRSQVLDDLVDDVLRILIGHQPAGDLGVRDGRHDRVDALAEETAPRAVDLEGRARPDPLER